MYLVRRVLEVEATRRAAVNLAGTDSTHRKLREARTMLDALREGDPTAQGWLQEAVRIDVALHDLIAENCASPRLCHEIDRYKELMVCVREIVGNERSVQQIAMDEHVAIVDHLLAGHTNEAADAVHRHLEHTAELVAALVFPAENGARADLAVAR